MGQLLRVISLISLPDPFYDSLPILSFMSQLENKVKELEYRIGELEEEIFGRRQEGGQKLLTEKQHKIPLLQRKRIQKRKS